MGEGTAGTTATRGLFAAYAGQGGPSSRPLATLPVAPPAQPHRHQLGRWFENDGVRRLKSVSLGWMLDKQREGWR